jgi:RNA polymerase sigma factor for flagellar operon FliA
MTPEETYLGNLRTIERIAAFVARRNHLNDDEAAEFTQEVRVRLLDDDYGIIRKFRGQSTFSTYLTTVIMRLLHKWRVEQWGKWRPSAEAKRIGEKAILLERLLTRDGYTYGEAVSMLTTPATSGWTTAEIESIYVRLPERRPRTVMVSEEVLPESASVEPDALERVESPERETMARKAAQTIDGLLHGMDAEDRLILQMRFWDARKVPEIARALHIEQKKIYKRLERLFVSLRRELERAGVSRDAVSSLLSRGDQEIRVSDPGIHPLRLSNPPGSAEGRGMP